MQIKTKSDRKIDKSRDRGIETDKERYRHRQRQIEMKEKIINYTRKTSINYIQVKERAFRPLKE